MRKLSQSRATKAFLEEFRLAVECRLDDLGWSRADLAKRMGVTRTWVTQMLKPPHKGVGMRSMLKMCCALGLHASLHLVAIKQKGTKR